MSKPLTQETKPMWDSVADSQAEERSRVPQRGRRFGPLMEGDAMKAKLKRERAEFMEANGLVYCDLGPGTRVVRHKRDCVVHPSGLYQPKIEYLMDKLGPEEVTKRLRAAGIHFRSIKSVTPYKELIQGWIIELQQKKKAEKE